MDKSGLHKYRRVFSATLIVSFFFFLKFHPRHFHPILSPFLYPSCILIPTSSLLPSLSPGHYSALPLYERLLFKTLRSDLVPTEAIPLAALCIYHGSPILSRLLTLQFSLLPPPLPCFSLLSLRDTHISHLSCFLLFLLLLF